MRIGVNDARSSSDTLQPDRLPHQHEFVVLSGGHDNHVARRRRVDTRLDRATAVAKHLRLLSAYRNRHAVNGLLAIPRSDDQLATLRWSSTAGVLRLLLDATRRHVGWSSHDYLCVTPAANRRRNATDHNARHRVARSVAGSRRGALPAEAIVPSN